MRKKFSPTKLKTIKFAVFDIESYKWIHPYALGFYDGNEYTEFLGKTCISDFLKFILKKKYRAFTIYAHNGGRFDFNFLMEILKTWNYKVDMVFQGARMLMLKVYLNLYQNEEGKTTHSNIIKFVDSVGLLRFKLDDLTKDFNVEHKKINFMDKKDNEKDYEYLYRLYKEDADIFHTYLKNDCLGLYEVLNKFDELIRENNGYTGLTIASTSLRTFQCGYLKGDIKMTTKEVNDEMKLAYYGGRTEIFKMLLPESKYKCYDVNSLYPFVMFNNDFPIDKPKTIHNPSLNMIKEVCGITECHVITPKELYLPVLPYKYKIGNFNKLIFPLGKFKGYWDNAQLKKALELGYKITPHKMLTFKTDYIFKDYVKRFYKLKQDSKADTPSYILAKLMLNSLYGKFAQNQDSELVKKLISAKEKAEYDIVGIVDADYNLFRVKAESHGNFFIPQISIHVTALAQLRLYHFLQMLHEKGHTVAYCDTDSLFTDGRLPVSNKLGDMKEEYKFISGYFLLPKTYCVTKKDGTCKVKAKGYTQDFQDLINENSFRKALLKNDYSDFNINTGEEKFNTIRTSIVRHKTCVSTDIRKKSIKAKYDKRKILKDYDTVPLKI